MVVIDRRGRNIGVITRIRVTRGYAPAVRLHVNGAEITVRTSELTPTRDKDEAVISLSPSQIRTRAILNTG